MKNIFLFNKIVIFVITFLLIGTTFFPSIESDLVETNSVNGYVDCQEFSLLINESVLDLEFIYNITKDLSYIIFTEYNESAGEIAKGRTYGSKGEHKAAEILYDNMTKLGLYTTMEQIHNTPLDRKLTHSYDVIDYKLILKNKNNDHSENVDCFISAIELDPPLVHERIYNFTFEGLKIRNMPRSTLGWMQARAFDKKGEDYVFISDIRSGLSRDPNPSLPFDLKLIRHFFYPIRPVPSIFYTYARRDIQQLFLDTFSPNCKGIIVYDFTNDTHNTCFNSPAKKLPAININGTVGRRIIQDIENYSVDIYVKEMYNKSVISYNVVGQLNGTDSSKTVIVDCLYDSVSCQGTGDAAIGMAIVMGIAKYFTDHNIVPKYNMKFIGFGGEEAGLRGVKSYEYEHRNERIIYVIDMNQVGSAQKDPPLTLNLIVNNFRFMKELKTIAKETNFAERVENTDIDFKWWPEGAPSDDQIFAHRRPFCKTVCFLEDFPWIWHHRDGLNHTAGDVFDHVDWNDVSVTGELVLNITKHITIDMQD